MKSSITALAAHNNAMWCDAVCRAHDHPGEFHGALWLTRLGYSCNAIHVNRHRTECHRCALAVQIAASCASLLGGSMPSNVLPEWQHLS
jgi:hypothetical protein